MGSRQGPNRFPEKSEPPAKTDSNAAVNAQAAWSMYGQAGWNQAAASQYQSWAQYHSGMSMTNCKLNLCFFIILFDSVS